MTDQGNLFAAPDRPRKLVLRAEREWERGDDCWSIHGSLWTVKRDEALWTVYQELDGEFGHAALVASSEALLTRFGSSLWSSRPKMATAEGWRAHWGG